MPSSKASTGRGPDSAAPHLPPGSYRAAALLLWPRLDPDGVRRAGDDPVRLGRLAERRTGIPLDRIVAMLERAAAAFPDDAAHRRRQPVAIPVRPDARTAQAAGPDRRPPATPAPEGIPAEEPVAEPIG